MYNIGPSPHADGAMLVLRACGLLRVPGNMPVYEGTNIPVLSVVCPSAKEYETKRIYSPRFDRMITVFRYICRNSESVRKAYDFVLHCTPHLNDVVTFADNGSVAVIVLDHLG